MAGPLPYASSRQYGSTIADILARQGDIAAQGAARSGEIWGGAVQQLGGIAAGAIQQHQERKSQEKREAAFSEALNGWDPADPRGSIMRLARVTGPDDAMKFGAGLMSLEAARQKQKQGEIPTMQETQAGVVAAHVLQKNAPGMFAQQYPMLRGTFGPALRTHFGIDLPEAVTPEIEQGLGALAQEWGKGGKEAGFTLSPGGVRFDESGRQIAAVPAAAREAPKTLGEIEAEAEARARGGRKGAPPEPPQPSFQAKDVLNDEGKPVAANFNARTGQYIEAATGKPIKNPRPVSSAAETQDTRKFKQAGPILTAVSELSEKINTLQGVAAKASGEVEKQKAKINLNDNVAEYEALIQGFTPLVARALGHTGVLTQQDVDSVRMLFPRPGDSKSLRDRKVARINGIVTQLEAGGATGEAPGAGEWTTLPGGLRIREKK